MKNIFKLTLLYVILLSAIGCSDEDRFCIEPTGNLVEKEFVFGSVIKGLEMAVPADVYLIQNNTQRINVESQENILDELQFKMNSDILIVEWDVDCVESNVELNFDVDLPEIKELSIISSGNLFGPSLLEVDDIDLNIIGSGNMDVLIEGDEIKSLIAGSGNIDLGGDVNDFEPTITGSGNVNGFDLVAEKVKVSIVGSGNAYVRATNQLDVTIAGSGNVYYRGNPEITITITGSGQLISAN